ncbi:MAG: hypothetical protein IPK13_00980 [Deltaproteobacteria bacterium]|nr:hypothetical protein [Deltaproteobacteria bacterium]
MKDKLELASLCLAVGASLGIGSLLAACGDDGIYECNGGGSANTLSGSYCENTEMVFTEVALLLVDSTKTLRIEYVNGDRTNKTLQILVTPRQDAPFVPDQTVYLTEIGATVQRFAASATAPINLTSELESTSNLLFSKYLGEVGSEAAGEFHLQFKTGRTLEGEFEGVIVDALAATGN